MSWELESVDVSLASAAREHAYIYRHTGIFDGSTLTVTYLVDQIEHKTRRDAGIGAILNERLLAALMSLPESDLAPLQRRFMRSFEDPRTSALALIVDDPNGRRWGQRRLGVPVQVLEIETRAGNWAHGCAVAHEWVGYAARTVRVEGVNSEDKSMILTEAAHYGLGLVEGANARRLLEPSPYRPRRWTSARWRFAELVYDQFRALDLLTV